MLRRDVQPCDQGTILMTVLVVLSVLSFLVSTALQSVIMSLKMQNNWVEYNAVFARAELGLMQLRAQFQEQTLLLPYSSIVLKTDFKGVQIDVCGNKTVDFTATAVNPFSRVTLNSRDIFARVPRLKNCNAIPMHQVIWQYEA